MGDPRKKSFKETSPKKEELSDGTENIFLEDTMKEGIKLFDEGKYIEALEMLTILSEKGNILGRIYLARCYYKLEKYEIAYKHFQHVAENGEGKYKDYGVSMIAAIEIIWGNYGKAIKIFQSLPKNVNNQINLSILYWKKYKVLKEEYSIREAMKILNKINTSELENQYIRRIMHLKALIYQAQKDYKVSETLYIQALEIADDDISRGQILNDFSSLYIECKRYDEAEELLTQARHLVLGKSQLEEAYNDKWLGILAIKKKNYELAKFHLTKAVKIIREKDLLREVAGIVFLLADLSKEEGFYKAADHYADGIALERLLEEVKDSDEKIVSFYFSSFFGHSSNNSSNG